MICCTFAGHRDILHPHVAEGVEAALNELLDRDDSFCFYTGGMGAFDLLCARTVRTLRQLRPEKQIRLILVEPYMKQSINTSGQWLQSQYDDIIIPEELAGVHYKSAIMKRNQWMADQSQYLIAYVHRDFGGAYQAMTYARKHGLNVIQV